MAVLPWALPCVCRRGFSTAWGGLAVRGARVAWLVVGASQWATACCGDKFSGRGMGRFRARVRGRGGWAWTASRVGALTGGGVSRRGGRPRRLGSACLRAVSPTWVAAVDRTIGD